MLLARNGTNLNITVTNATLLGDVIFQDTSSGLLSLTQGSQLKGLIDPVDVSVDASSTWTMTGNSLLKSLSLAGKIDMQAPAGAFTPKTLTVASLNGQNGTLTMNVQLGGNGSGADRLVVDGGTVTGSTKLAIRNASGLGAQTTGDGILLVQAVNGATTTAQSGKDGFKLAGPVTAEPTPTS